MPLSPGLYILIGALIGSGAFHWFTGNWAKKMQAAAEKRIAKAKEAEATANDKIDELAGQLSAFITQRDAMREEMRAAALWVDQKAQLAAAHVQLRLESLRDEDGTIPETTTFDLELTPDGISIIARDASAPEPATPHESDPRHGREGREDELPRRRQLTE